MAVAGPIQRRKAGNRAREVVFRAFLPACLPLSPAGLEPPTCAKIDSVLEAPHEIYLKVTIYALTDI